MFKLCSSQNILYNKNELVNNRIRNEMLEDFLSKLGASTKITVGLSISPSVGLEMVDIERSTGIVNKYSNKPLEYNYSTREIEDYDQLQESLEELFEELHLSKRNNVILSIPSVHFGMIQLPLLLTEEAVTNAIISEVEQSYIFKRQKPVVSWVEVSSNINTENRTLAYAAIQETALDGIIAACEEVGCTLVGVEPSYSSLLRALYYTKVTEEQMKDNVSWNLMIIGQNSYSIFSMMNKKIIEYYEEPLALKSFIDDEIYNAITTSAKLTLVGLPASHLFIISETDLVSAEVLSMRMSIESKVHFLECNKYVQNELTPVSLDILPNKALQLTPEAIGVTVYPFCDFPIKLNLLQDKEVAGLSDENKAYPRVNIGKLEVELTPDFIKKISLILGAILVLPLVFIALFLNKTVIPKEQSRLNVLKTNIQQSKTSLQTYRDTTSKDNTFDLNASINKVCAQNSIKLIYYDALGASIPSEIWIISYALDEAGKVDIKGKSTNVKNVYIFYKNIKQLVNGSDVRLYTLEISPESLDAVISNTSNGPKYYNFEITNMNEADLGTLPSETKQPESSSSPKQPSQSPAAASGLIIPPMNEPPPALPEDLPR